MNASATETAQTAGRATSQIRLAVDARVWKTGIGTYTLNILSAVHRLDPEIHITAICRTEAVETISSLCDELRIVDVPIYTLREQIRIPVAARGCDLLHLPHYNVPVLYRGALVVTIHDLNHLTVPAFRSTLKARVYAGPMLQLAARKAVQVVTVSEYSKKQIVRTLNVASERVSVIHNGVDPSFRPSSKPAAAASVEAALKIDRPYILYVGSLKPHKNLGTLARAFALVRSRSRLEHLLVLVGDDRKYRQAVMDDCMRLGLGDSVRHFPWVSPELLPQTYAAADLVVMPSTSEGFGLPVLEAMACGTPVASSNATSLPEVGGHAVEYFNPYSVEEMAAVIERVLCSPGLQAKLREKGLQQAANFTWEECARQHIEVYQKALAKDPKQLPSPEKTFAETSRQSAVRSKWSKGVSAERGNRTRIGLNVSAATGRYAGVGKYALQLAKYLPRVAPDEEWVFFGPGPGLAPELSRENARVIAAGKSGPARILWEQTALPLAVRSERISLLHGTDFSRPIACRGLVVNTIHDLSPFSDPHFFSVSRRMYKQALIPLAVRRSAAIITVSEFSRNSILEQFPSLEGRVFVIHHGVERVPVETKVKGNSGRPFLLHVGGLENRKNLVLLVQAFRMLQEKRRIPHRLVLAGNAGYGAEAVRIAIRSSGVLGAVDVLGYVNSQELARLYRSASALVFPSVYEGFGFPVLEAMAHGTPVVCSNATSLPEIGGDAPVYFNPHDVEEMAAAIERVIDSPSLRMEMKEKGLKRVAQFTWEECARRHVEVYRKVLGPA